MANASRSTPTIAKRRPRTTRSLDPDADRAADARATQTAVTIRILRQVLLVIVLGEIEIGRRQDLGGDQTVTRLRQRLLELLLRMLRRLALLFVEEVDPRSILRADVVPLPHALRRIVALPERLQQLVIRDLLRIEHHEHDLVVPGQPGAAFPIRRVLGLAARVAGGGRVDARQLPELLLGAPETAEPEHRPFHPIRIGTVDRGVLQHVVFRRHRPLLGAALQRIGSRRHLRFLFEHRGPRDHDSAGDPWSRTAPSPPLMDTSRTAYAGAKIRVSLQFEMRKLTTSSGTMKPSTNGAWRTCPAIAKMPQTAKIPDPANPSACPRDAPSEPATSSSRTLSANRHSS